jgi:hypothetical protein
MKLPLFVFHLCISPRLKDEEKNWLAICNASFPLVIKAISRLLRSEGDAVLARVTMVS